MRSIQPSQTTFSRHQTHELEKAQILNALFIIDNLTSDIEAITNTIEI